MAALHQPERRGRVTVEHATNANPMMQHACGTEPGRPYVSKKRKGTAAVSDAFAAHQLRGPTPQAESLDTRSCRPSACLLKPRTQRGNPTLALRPCRLQSFSLPYARLSSVRNDAIWPRFLLAPLRLRPQGLFLPARSRREGSVQTLPVADR